MSKQMLGQDFCMTALGRQHQVRARQSSHLTMVRFHWQLQGVERTFSKVLVQ